MEPSSRLTSVLDALSVPRSSWYREPICAEQRKRPGPPPNPIPPEIVCGVTTVAESNPWYGYKRVAIVCRRLGLGVPNRPAYRVMKKADLLQKRGNTTAALHQTRKLFDLLPTAPNQLWQMDVTYVHIPTAGWWYVITVIDYYSRYLLAAHLTPTYAAHAAETALDQAIAEAERLRGPLESRPFLVTDNGSTFTAHRFARFLQPHFEHVRIQYRTPTQLGLLERFHGTFKKEEVHWRLWDGPAHGRECIAEFRARYNDRRPHWALVPDDGGDPVTPTDVYVHGVVTQLPRWQSWAKAAKERLEELRAAS